MESPGTKFNVAPADSSEDRNSSIISNDQIIRIKNENSSLNNSDTAFNLTTHTARAITNHFRFQEGIIFNSLKSDGYGLVHLNLNGTPFLVPQKTLNKNPILYQKLIEDAKFLSDTNEYFIERDPVIFNHVLAFLRHDELHLPESICGPLLEKELDLWGIPMGLDIQRCCLGRVTESKLTLECLEKFESYFRPVKYECITWIKNVKWQRIRELVWNVLNLTPEMIETTVEKSEEDNDEVEEDNLDEFSRIEKYRKFRQLNKRMPTLHEIAFRPNNKIEKRVLLAGRLCFAYIVYQLTLILLSFVIFILSSMEQFHFSVELKNLIDNPRNCSLSNLAPNHYLDAFSKGCYIDNYNWIDYVSYTCSCLFTIDLISRFLFAPKASAFITWYNLLDFLSILPFWMHILFIETTIEKSIAKHDYYTLERMLEILSVLNFVKITISLRIIRFLIKYTPTRVLFYSIRNAIKDMLVLFVMFILLMTFFGAGIFYFENNLQDIPTGMWFALITMTTVGYGDIVPIQTTSRVLASFLVIIGLLLTSYIVPIIVNNFAVLYNHASQLEYLISLHETANQKQKEQVIRYLPFKLLKRIRNEKEKKKNVLSE